VPWGLTLTAGGAGEQHAYGMAGLWSGTTLPEPNNGYSFDGGNGHLTGWGAAPTIDQIIAQAYGANMPYQKAPDDANPETRYRSIALGVQCGSPNSVTRMCYTGVNAPITPEVSPKAAYDRYFMGVTPSGMTPTEDPALTRARAEKHAVVDLLKNDLARIRTQRRLRRLSEDRRATWRRDGDGAADHAAADHAHHDRLHDPGVAARS
jgi:hypothetical protein